MADGAACSREPLSGPMLARRGDPDAPTNLGYEACFVEVCQKDARLSWSWCNLWSSGPALAASTGMLTPRGEQVLTTALDVVVGASRRCNQAPSRALTQRKPLAWEALPRMSPYRVTVLLRATDAADKSPVKQLVRQNVW